MRTGLGAHLLCQEEHGLFSDAQACQSTSIVLIWRRGESVLIPGPSAGISGSMPAFLALQLFLRLSLPPEDPSPCCGSEAGASGKPAPTPGPQPSLQRAVVQFSPGLAPPRPPRSPARPRSPAALWQRASDPQSTPSPVDLTHQDPTGQRGGSRNPSRPRLARAGLNFGAQLGYRQ